MRIYTVRGHILELSKFIKKNLPEISNADPRRLKLKVWRIKASGIEADLEKSLRQDPSIEQQTRANLDRWRFAQRVADFIRSQPGKRASQREILRHFSNRRETDIEEIREILTFFFKIRPKEDRRTPKDKSRSYTYLYECPSIEWIRAETEEAVKNVIMYEAELFKEEELIKDDGLL